MTTEENDAIWLESTIIKTKSGKTLEIINQLDPNYYITKEEKSLRTMKNDLKEVGITLLIALIVIGCMNIFFVYFQTSSFVLLWLLAFLIIVCILCFVYYIKACITYRDFIKKLPFMHEDMQKSIEAYQMKNTDRYMAHVLTNAHYQIIDYEVINHEKIMFENVTTCGDYHKWIFEKIHLQILISTMTR